MAWNWYSHLPISCFHCFQCRSQNCFRHVLRSQTLAPLWSATYSATWLVSPCSCVSASYFHFKSIFTFPTTAMSFPVTSVMQITHPNECASVTILQPWKPPGGLHLVLPRGTTGMVLSHWPENGAIQRVLFTVCCYNSHVTNRTIILHLIAQVQRIGLVCRCHVICGQRCSSA